MNRYYSDNFKECLLNRNYTSNSKSNGLKANSERRKKDVSEFKKRYLKIYW